MCNALVYRVHVSKSVWVYISTYIPCTDISVILVCSFRRVRLADWTSACTTTVAASCEGAGAEGRRHTSGIEAVTGGVHSGS